MIPPCPRCGKDDFKKTRDRTNHLNRKNKCKPKAIPEVQIHEPVPVTEPVVVPSSSQKNTTCKAPIDHLSIEDLTNWLANPEIKNNPSIISKKIPKTDAEWFDLMESQAKRKSPSKTQKKTKVSHQSEENPEAGPGPATQVNRKKSAKLKERKIVIPITAVDIQFEERSVGIDLERPHQNRSIMTLWVGKIPHPEDNPAYAFNKPIFDIKKYRELPYIPQLIGASRTKIKEVYQTELNKKDQIKSTIVVKCLYSFTKNVKGERPEKSYVDRHHRGGMRAILSEGDIDEHITRSTGKIDKQVEDTLQSGSGYVLEQILEISIEVYTLRRGTGGSFKPTPKGLTNKKCTINPDNKGLIDPETKRLSEKCLQGALACYYADQDGHTDHLERIFRATKYKPYLDVVNLDGIPMPTPICPHIFNKIEEMNPDISISVWEWKEETATPKPVIASKNFKRKHKIRLLAFTDITKSEDNKYGQKNHFLWIKNSNRLIYGDTAHKEKKYLCDGCTQSWPSEKSLKHHLEWCPGIHEEAPQRVTMPMKGVNDFEKFKNYGRMINAPCVIIADFEADNKKCDEKYGGQMRKLAEQKANSFCYLVHWIDTGDIWGPFLYRGENATQEFV
jgi:hypothetical protein